MRFRFFLDEALGSLRRNWVITLAAVLTVFISMVILGLVLVMNRNLNQGATSLKNRVMIEVFIRDEAPVDQVEALKNTIAGMAEVKSFRYISKDEALREFRKRLGADADQILQNLTTNPLPASYRIYVKNADQVDAVAKRFFNEPAVDNSPGSTLDLVTKGMWGGTALFAVAGVLLISTTVRLSIFARRNEIEIMRLVGATNWFIRWPFMLEGFITGLFGSIAAAVGVWGVNKALADWISGSSLDFLSVRVYPLWFKSTAWPLGLMPTLVLFGALLGSFGSGIALRRYLRV